MFQHVLTSCCINCCQSAILALAFRVWLKSTFREVDVHVKGTVLLHFLQAHISNSKFVNSKKNKKQSCDPQIHHHGPVFLVLSL